jgi:hypothetical protein
MNLIDKLIAGIYLMLLKIWRLIPPRKEKEKNNDQ